ncbi:putative ribonuclease H-like domain-containing protein [Tanacetum coccineum]
MLATGRYAQWRSQFLRYIDTRPNGDALRKCILKGPYTPTIVTTPAVPATKNSPAVPEQTTVETVMNMTPENRAHFESEKKAIHLILTGIRDEIYSTVDACQTTQEIWEAIERLQQGTKFLNKTLNAFFKEEGIEHQTSTPRTPEQNGVVERRNRTLVEAAHTMLSASKLPLFFWAEAIATACYTQNRSNLIPSPEKWHNHIITAENPQSTPSHLGALVNNQELRTWIIKKKKRSVHVWVGYYHSVKGISFYNREQGNS